MTAKYRKLSAGCLIGIGVLTSACILISGAWHPLASVLGPSTGFRLYGSISGLCFGLTMYQVMAQSRPYRKEAISGKSTLKAVSIGVVSGLVFLVGSVALGALYVQAGPPPGEFSLKALLVRVLVGAIMSATVGSTFYVPLLGAMGNLAADFLDYQGIPLYATGAIGGGAGAIIGAINSTQAVEWWIRMLATLVAGVGGAAVGLVLAAGFIALFTMPFARRTASRPN